ncbi:MAG: cation:proton antiporter [Bacteroidales bacterium]|jgi:NhaP-type Na+/H+ or K+/H+ antiporter|nr:cation:proton antiporter [Bacteroidales bacterium]
MNSAIPLSLVFLGLMVFLAHLFAAFYRKRMVPDVLMLMIIGLIIGPIFGLVTPGDFGGFGPVFTTITLVVILFESGTCLSLSTLKASWKSTTTLTFAAFFATVFVLGAIVYIFLDFSVNSAITLGAILGGTSSAVVIPLVQQLKIGEETKTALILESAINDVLCIVLALACVQTFQQGEINFGITLGSVISSFTLATLMGIGCAMIWSRFIRLVRRLQNSIFTTPAFVFVVYGMAELLGFNGAIAALAFGVTMANIDTFKGFIVQRIMGGPGHKLNDTEMVFLRELTFLLKTFFFVYIGMSILFEDWTAIVNGLIFTAVVYVLRLIVAKYASPRSANLYDKSVISMMTPKGLAAAVLATIPEMAGVPEGTMIKNITYAVVLFSIVVTSVLMIINNKSNKLQGFYQIFLGE